VFGCMPVTTAVTKHYFKLNYAALRSNPRIAAELFVVCQLRKHKADYTRTSDFQGTEQGSITTCITVHHRMQST
jgi:hypothetical protein